MKSKLNRDIDLCVHVIDDMTQRASRISDYVYNTTGSDKLRKKLMGVEQLLGEFTTELIFSSDFKDGSETERVPSHNGFCIEFDNSRKASKPISGSFRVTIKTDSPEGWSCTNNALVSWESGMTAQNVVERALELLEDRLGDRTKKEGLSHSFSWIASCSPVDEERIEDFFCDSEE